MPPMSVEYDPFQATFSGWLCWFLDTSGFPDPNARVPVIVTE